MPSLASSNAAGQRRQPHAVHGCQRLERPARRALRDRVEAFSLVDAARHLVVVAAHDRLRTQFLDACDHRIGIGAVADDVAEAQRPIVPAGGRVREARLERFEIRVDIGQDEVAHRKRITGKVHNAKCKRSDLHSAFCIVHFSASVS